MLMSEMRKEDEAFDEWLKSKFSFIVDHPNPNIFYYHTDTVSLKLNDMFSFIEPLLTYKEIFKEHFHRILEEHYADNVMYIEFRSYLPYVYDLDGKKYGPVECITIYKEILKKFLKNHPDFHGAKLIYAPLVRNINATSIVEYGRIYKKIKMAHSDFVIGYDLIGNENFGIPLNELKNFLPNDILYYLNGAETNWYETSNLINHLLPNTKRIGHGYSLIKRPEIMETIKELDIAIEICPISNQVFNLINDLRNHPANTFISNNYSIVIGNDYPALWGAKGLSYDWYLTFIGLTNNKTDLRFLKRLAINSYLYSSMDRKKMKEALTMWQARWNFFINTVNKEQKIGFIRQVFNWLFF